MSDQPRGSQVASHLAMAMVTSLPIVTLTTGVAVRFWGLGGALLEVATFSHRELETYNARMVLGQQIAAVGMCSLIVCVIVWCLLHRFPITAPISAIATGAACTWAVSTLHSPPHVVPVLLASLWAIVSTVATSWTGMERRQR